MVLNPTESGPLILRIDGQHYMYVPVERVTDATGTWLLTLPGRRFVMARCSNMRC